MKDVSLALLRGCKRVFNIGPAYKARNGKIYDKKETPEEYKERISSKKA